MPFLIFIQVGDENRVAALQAGTQWIALTK